MNFYQNESTLVADIWPSVPETVGLNDKYWQEKEQTYHLSNRLLHGAGFQTITCLMTLKERSSFKRDDIDYEFFPVDNRDTFFRRQTSRSMVHFLKKVQPQIIVIHLLNREMTTLLLSESALEAKRILQVNTYHTSGTTFEYIQHHPQSISAIIVNAPSLKTQIQEDNSFLDIPFIVLPSAVDLDIFYPQPEVIKKWDIVWTGQLRDDDDKQADLLLEIIRGCEYKLLIVGDGPKRRKLEIEVSASGLSSQVDFCGWIDYSRLPLLLNQSKIYVTPSSLDPAPRGLTEALACGLPALGFENCLGIEAQIIHHKNGYRVSNTREMRLAIPRLLEDEPLYRYMSRESRAVACRYFNPPIRVQRLIDFYRGVLSA